MTRLLNILHKLEDSVLVLLVCVMLLVACGQIVLRNLFSLGFIWADPLVRHLVLWTGFWGAMIATRQNKHIQIDAVLRFLPAKLRSLSLTFSLGFSAVICAILAYTACNFILDEKNAGTQIFLEIPTWQIQLILPLAFGVIACRFLFQAAQHLIVFFKMKSPPLD